MSTALCRRDRNLDFGIDRVTVGAAHEAIAQTEVPQRHHRDVDPAHSGFGDHFFSRPTGGDELSETTYIQRLNTVGGVAPPSTSCAASGDVGTMALVPYSADYFFYKAIKRISSR